MRKFAIIMAVGILVFKAQEAFACGWLGCGW